MERTSGIRPTTTEDFNSLFRNSVETGLSLILGEAGKFVILKNFNLNRLMDSPAGIDRVLVEVFKEYGAPILERTIVKELFGSLDERTEDTSGMGFLSAVNLAKEIYEKRRDGK